MEVRESGSILIVDSDDKVSCSKDISNTGNATVTHTNLTAEEKEAVIDKDTHTDNSAGLTGDYN